MTKTVNKMENFKADLKYTSFIYFYNYTYYSLVL